MKRTMTERTEIVSSGKASKKGRSTFKRKRVNEFRVPRGIQTTRAGMPKQLRMKHNYTDNVTISATTGVLQSFLIRCNGMFDPNATGVGHQPMYFDQLSAMYNHFTVLKSKITLQVSLLSTSAAEIGVCGIYIEDDSSVVATSFVIANEQETSVFGQVNNQFNQPTRFTKTWDAVQAFGPNPLANDNLQGSASADPTEQQTFVCYFQDANSAATLTGFGLITVEYDVIWDELKNVTSS